MKSVRKLGHSLQLIASLSAVLPAVTAFALPVVATAVVGASVSACADEADPKTWVKRLNDKTDRPAAIKKLHDEYFQKALSKAGNDRDAPDVKAILDVIAQPLAQTYIDLATGDEGLRKELIKDLADLRDVRTAPAFTKALQSYEQGKNEDEVSQAILGTKGLAVAGRLADKDGNVSDPNATKLIEAYWDLFSKFERGKATSDTFTKDSHDTVLEIVKATKASNPYGQKALEKLSVPIKESDDQVTRDNQDFWQGTSVQVISELRYAPAVRALLVAMLTPTKRLPLIYNAARTALLKMPKEAEVEVIKALKGTDPEFKKLIEVPQKDKDGKVVTYKEETPETGPDGKPSKDKIHHKGDPVADKDAITDNYTSLASVLALISRPAGRDALLDLMPNAEPSVRAAFAGAIVDMPTNDPAALAKVKAAFLDAYKAAKKDDKKSLIGRVAQLYDPSLVDFLVTESQDKDAEVAIRAAALDGAVRLMKADQEKSVNDAIQKLIDKVKTLDAETKKKEIVPKATGPAGDKERKEKEADIDKGEAAIIKSMNDSYNFAKAPIDACAATPTDAMCYVKLLDKPIPASPADAHMSAIKACWMAVILGEASKAEAARKALVERIDKITDVMARSAVALAVDELAPQGDPAAAEAFEKLVEKDKGLNDKNLNQADDVVAKVAFRLRGRAAK